MTTINQNFVCIGAQKAGTTTLSDILSQHPDIYIPPIKETKYFLFDEDYARGKTFYDSYFKTWTGQRATGEFDPDYLLFPFTAERIAGTLGKQTRIIVMLRNPADRAYSHYLMTRKKGLEPLDFKNALREEKNRKHNIKEQKIYAYLERGYYGRQLEAFMNVFPQENFLFLVFEQDFLGNREATSRRIQEFLGVTYTPLNTDVHSNEAGEARNEAIRDLVRKPNFAKKIIKSILPSKAARKNIRRFFIRKNMQKVSAPKLEADVRKEIITNYYIDDIHLTEKLTGRDLSIWYS